jgi:hypothetical protein
MRTTKRIARWLTPQHRRPFELPQVSKERREAGDRNALVLGNCQARPVAACLQALNADVTFTGLELPMPLVAQRLQQRDPDLHETLAQYQYLLLQPAIARLIVDSYPDLAERVRRFPFIVFSAFHPDLVYVSLRGQQKHLLGPLGHYNSAIALWAYLRGLSPKDSVALFNERTYGALGYFSHWEASCQAVREEAAAADFALDDALEEWRCAGCFMYSINHPMPFVCASIAQRLLSQLRLPALPAAARFVADEFADGPVWPVYREIGERLGIEGDYYFKVEEGRCPPEKPVMMLELHDFIESSFEAFGQYQREELWCERLQSTQFQQLPSLAAPAAAAPVPMTGNARRTPYSDLPAHQFWRNAVSSLPHSDVDPVVSARFQFTRESAIATAGSCFAQHISEWLQRIGFNFLVTESDEVLPLREARRRGFGVFSARFGNIYTARQLLQLFERAYGVLHPADEAWLRPDGRHVDPFRPQIEPDGFASPEAVMQARVAHFHAVRAMFESLDVFVFTLGLTEAWQSKIDGAVFPLAPGVAGGIPDPSRYEFVNFEVAEVVADLERFIPLLARINPKARLILTVSPVPLIATYESQHVLVSTTYSKSVLRAAAGQISSKHQHCAYFPSYEIVTGNHARGAYFESDLRNVNAAGVDHVMRLFLRHYASVDAVGSVDAALLKELNDVREIFCDEEAIAT